MLDGLGFGFLEHAKSFGRTGFIGKPLSIEHIAVSVAWSVLNSLLAEILNLILMPREATISRSYLQAHRTEHQHVIMLLGESGIKPGVGLYALLPHSLEGVLPPKVEQSIQVIGVFFCPQFQESQIASP